MTDDLDMGAILNEYGLEETIRLAIGAGNDLAMICHRVPAIDEARRALGKVARGSRFERALASVARFKTKLVAAGRVLGNCLCRRSTREVWDLRVAVLGEEERRRTQSRRRQTLSG